MIAAIVLNWNGLAATRRCLASLADQTVPVTTWVVDNGSTDGSATALAAEPGIAFEPLPDNLGFAGGMNRGIGRAIAAGARHVLLVNNDAELAPDAVETLVAALDADPAAAAAAPTIYRGHPPERGALWYAGGRLARWAGVVVHETRAAGAETRPVGFATACCLLVRAEAYMAVGGLDEAYFLYFEDADFCDRLQAAGYRLLYVPAAEAWHDAGASTGSQHAKAASLDYYDVRNGLRFAGTRLHGPRRWSALAYLFALRLPRKTLRILAGARNRRASLRAVWLGLRDGWGGRSGPFSE